MTLHLQELYAFSLPLTRELMIAEQPLQNRTGFFIVLQNAQGLRGIGEVAPLPGFHQETCEDCLDLVSRHRDFINSLCIDECLSGPPLLPTISQTFAPFSDVPSLHFGLAMAMLNLLAELRGTHPARILDENPLTDLTINGLVTTPCSQWDADTKPMIEAGYRILKLKVGRSHLIKESQALQALQKKHDDSVTYILDGNQGWSAEEASDFMDSIDIKRIRYGEELVADPYKLSHLSKQLKIAMALDETLFHADAHDALIQDWPGYFILKPDRIQGGLEQCLTLAERAKQQNAHAIISSAYNTPVGLSFLAQVAAAIHSPHAGLDTFRWLPEVDKRFQVENGHIHIPHCRINDLDALTPYIEKVW